MKRTSSSQETKRALAASLKKLMNKKPLSKITINEIVQDCGLNRNSFYYHFEDIYALFKWMLEQEAVEVVKQFDLVLDYREAIQFVMDYVSENRHIVNGAYDAMGREGLKRFFYADFIDIVRLHRWRGGAVRRGRGRGLQEFPRRVLHRLPFSHALAPEHPRARLVACVGRPDVCRHIVFLHFVFPRIS